ncbi:hypothetical protein BT96DRAFT_976631 [Gymnopus androsaceus JB14]|uniref:Uncharacterized protein n=1 Tax=Gymnopus androsaceus JB14 TaxID=1447944 RepID=A0A6A4HMK3_9AGAR|nr:hypothetical protein BT96DRAFT_976631 [Gymnopus androsaceus JB14]
MEPNELRSNVNDSAPAATMNSIIGLAVAPESSVALPPRLRLGIEFLDRRASKGGRSSGDTVFSLRDYSGKTNHLGLQLFEVENCCRKLVGRNSHPERTRNTMDSERGSSPSAEKILGCRNTRTWSRKIRTLFISKGCRHLHKHPTRLCIGKLQQLSNARARGGWQNAERFVTFTVFGTPKIVKAFH